MASIHKGLTITVSIAENTSIEWKAKPIALADLHIPAQEFDYPEREAFGESLVYSPWFCLRDHEPLGAINLARREVYRELAALRKSGN